MDLSVVVPVYNEAGNIHVLVHEICRALDGELDYEIVVVDDGSDDATLATLQECRSERPELRVLIHAHRCGQSAATSSGVRAARAQWVATLDGDGQNDPADIMRLYQTMDSSPDQVMLVVGQRRKRKDSALKRFASRIANAVRARILKDETPDSASGIRLFARDLYLGLPQFDHMHRFLPALVRRQGGKTISIIVNHRERRGGLSKYGIMDRLWVGIVDLLGVRWLQRRYVRPEVSEVE